MDIRGFSIANKEINSKRNVNVRTNPKIEIAIKI